MDKLTIGKLAEECGITIDTIRYYERFKLVQAERRSKSGYRLYGPESVRRVMFIKRSKELGFTVGEIKKLLALKSAKDATCDQMLKRTRAKITESEGKIKELTHIEAALIKLANACPGGEQPISECPILDHLYQHHKNEKNS